jgi:hypothetical protein
VKAPLLAFLVAIATPAIAQTPDLSGYWPHGAGSSWTYDRVEILWGVAHKASFDAVRFDLGEARTIGAGIEVQPLDVTAPMRAQAEAPAFWRQLAWARPELAGKLAGVRPQGASSGVVIHDAVSLRITADEIAAYRESPLLRSWLYLDADTSPGHRFHIQLVPDLADSVYLDGEVIGRADLSTPAGDFVASLRVGYTVDYGWSDAVNDSGVVVGRTRSRTRGEMYWAPDVGPVLARETFVPFLETTGAPPPLGVDSTFAELRLQSWALVPTAIQPATWSTIKQRYR